ncbi:MAG: hypothetical protein H0X72_00750 [Acidobacteria bacterium]|jgi:hypothetical protein|nr:hypothetical protein [Acidobacteriota bacterium]
MYSKIQNLLEQAAAQAESSTAEVSSVTNATRNCSSETEAKNVFQRLIQKLFNIEQWNAESNLSSFALFDENGFAKMEKIAAVGDFIRITLPGSGKDDWVKIVEIHDAADEIVLTVQPSSNPTDKEDNSTTSHFFTNDSTNNFCLQKNGIKLNFYVIGLGEKSNTEDTSGIVETVRNFATANIGHYLGIQKAQWQNFCDNFVEIEK